MTRLQGGYNKMETCYFCKKGVLEDKKVTVDFRWGSKLIVIEEVPAKVCNECGEKYYSAEVSREMEKIATEGKMEKGIEVPLARLHETPSAVV
jgi:YgiT-type zinc finger domain-containing protein